MEILNIAGYKFVTLNTLSQLKTDLWRECASRQIKGTILLSAEGININLSGERKNIQAFLNYLTNDNRFADIRFHENTSTQFAFQRLKVKIKKEIITLRQPCVNAVAKRAPEISPQLLKQWLDEKRDITLLDTRNDYEVEMGTFEKAVNLQLKDFGDFPQAIAQVNRDKPIVMFCTGGIRCEKAALYMIEQGYPEVYQLDRGILGYFDQVGGAHYRGDCFVFDERVTVTPKHRENP